MKRMKILAALLATIVCALPAPAQYDETAKRFHVLPHIADGGGWQSFLLVTNVSSSASPCTLQLYGGLGVDRFEAASGVTAAGSTATFSLGGAGGHLVWRTRNELAEASGYATLDCVNPVVAQVVFAWIDSSGTPTGMATVFSSQAATVFQFPALTPEAMLGFAIANDMNVDAACRLVLQDPQRVNLGEVTLPVPAKSNRVQLLSASIPIPETFLEGSANVSCDQQVAMIGLHFELRSDGSIITFNTLPPAVVDPSLRSFDETVKNFHVLPHIADGGGWQSFLLVTNVSSSASPCTLQLYGGLGVDRFEAASGVTAAGLTATFGLAEAGGHLVWPTRNESAEVSGYATLDCVHPVVAQVVFAWIGGAERPTGMATVFSSQTATLFQFPVLTPEATLGFAIANDTNVEAACRFVLESPDGMNLGDALRVVPLKSNRSLMLNAVISIPEAFPGGTATVLCNQPVSMIAIHLELLPDGTIITFNTLPPAVLDTSPRTVTTSARDALVAFYHATGGENWTNNENWLTDRPLSEWHGIWFTSAGGIGLDLNYNNLKGSIPPELGLLANLEWLSLTSEPNLTGPIPPELGRLTKLELLQLSDNNLTGSIPPELGQLVNLEELSLRDNALVGPIPAELGRLTKLEHLQLSDNNLTGSIPPELGSLANLEGLGLFDNALTGPIPPELGRLTKLELLQLSGNNLMGSIPAELGSLTNLRRLILAGNTRMGGALAASLTRLGRLELLLLGNTGLCAPRNASFQNWLEGVRIQRVSRCGDGPPVYLTQAVQSRRFPVPLVAGEEALLRVFVTAPDAEGGSEWIPSVRARLYVDGHERHVVDIPGGSKRIPAEVDEGSLATSSNTTVPSEVVQPGLELVVEIDPDDTLDPGLGLVKRIPESGRLSVDVRAMPVFDLTVIPFVWSSEPDTSIVELVEAMAADPEGHELLWETRTLLPIADLDVTAHDSVMVDTNDAYSLFDKVRMIRAMEGSSGYYMGTMAGVSGASGVAYSPGKSIFARPIANTIAHELGHNLSLNHAPCGNPGLLDGSFPHTDGSIGAWGYDFRAGGSLILPSTPDLMSYCFPNWISEYNFAKALNYRLHEEAATASFSPQTSAPARSLLLWGGVDGGGAPYLEPAFVVDAPTALPMATGDHRIVGRSADGEELFSLTFQMPVVADADGRSSFAFILPVQPNWADELAGITLSGPGGSVTLDEDTDRPVTILRNRRTGQIRGILRGGAAAAAIRDDAASALSRVLGAEEFGLRQNPDVEALTSRGLPDPEDWRSPGSIRPF